MTTDFDPTSPEALACKSIPVAVETLHRSPTNPRKRFPAAALAELTESVRAHGVIQPIVVRPWPHDHPHEGDAQPLWEIVAGERRWRAATAAGVALVPAMVRNLTDAQVAELQIIENLQREDVLASEEAEGYRVMMDAHGYSADQLAEKVGKSRAYIFGRLKLLSLCAKARDALDDGEISPSVALVIARMPSAPQQQQALSNVKDLSYRQAFRILRERYSTALAQSTWDLADAELLPIAGACRDCPHNSSNSPDARESHGKNVCTHQDCFADKKRAALERATAQARDEGQAVIDGREAKKIAAYGHIGHDAPVVSLDDSLWEAPKKDDGTCPTVREFLADRQVPVILVEDTHNQRLVPTVEKTALAEALKSAGIKPPPRLGGDDGQKAREAKLKAEREFRTALIREIRQRAAAEFGAVKHPTLDEGGLRIVVRTLWDRTWSDTQKAVAAYYVEKDGPVTSADRVHALTESLDTMTPAGLCLLAITIALATAAGLSSYATDLSLPKPLESLARDYLLDPSELRRSLKARPKAGEKPRPPAKAPRGKGKTAPAEAPKPEAAPAKAARAAGKKPAPKQETAACAAKPKKKSGRASPAGETNDPAPVARCLKTRDIFEGASE